MQNTHVDRDFGNRLRMIRESLLLMAGRVEQMISQSMRALVERDVELAERTIALDQKVNRAEVETDELCLRTLARHHPAGSDLRFISLALKMVTDLERIGDLAVNICERALDLADAPVLEMPPQAERMTSIVESMVRDAIDAFVNGDHAMAQQIIDRDDEVDDLYGEAFQNTLARMQEQPAEMARGIHVLSVVKWLERMADHSTNLAEQVIFLTKGEDVRHSGKLSDPPPPSGTPRK